MLSYSTNKKKNNLHNAWRKHNIRKIEKFFLQDIFSMAEKKIWDNSF